MSSLQQVYKFTDSSFLFNNETETDLFFNSLNKIHPALKFTLDKETDYTLPLFRCVSS